MSQASQRLTRKIVGVLVMAFGVVLVLWGAGQQFRGHGAGLIVVAFGGVVAVSGYAIWQQA